MKRIACGFVAQERPAVFGGEDQMNVNGGKGLWHGINDAQGWNNPGLEDEIPLGFSERDSRNGLRFLRPAGRELDWGLSFVQSQRDCKTKPRVASNEQPWDREIGSHQPHRGCGPETT